MKSKEKVYVLLADVDGTMRSKDEPFGVAVRTKEAAKEYVENGGVGYSHSYEELRIFDTAREGIDWKFNKIEPDNTIKENTNSPLQLLKRELDRLNSIDTKTQSSHQNLHTLIRIGHCELAIHLIEELQALEEKEKLSQ